MATPDTAQQPIRMILLHVRPGQNGHKLVWNRTPRATEADLLTEQPLHGDASAAT